MFLILRSAQRVSKDVGRTGASWFETALTRLLTMRVGSHASTRAPFPKRCS
jgi:hypothetical protein